MGAAVFRAALRFVGRELPSKIDPFDAETYFSLSREDLDAIRASFRKHQYLVGLQLAVLRATGQFLGRNSRIPSALLRRFAQTFSIGTVEVATPRAVYKESQSTLYSHHKWVKEHAGFADYDGDVEGEVAGFLKTVATGASDLDHLVMDASIWLFEHKIVLPGDRRIRDVARAAMAGAEAEAVKTVELFLPAAHWPRLLGNLYERVPSLAVTRLEWLKQRPGKHSKTRIDEVKDRIDFLTSLGVDRWSLNPLTWDFLHARATEYGARPPAHNRKRIEQTQILEAVCFLVVTLAELTDDFLHRTSRRVMDACRAAEGRSSKARDLARKDAHALVGKLREIVDDNSRSAEDRLHDLRQLLEQFDSLVSQSKAQSLRAALADDQGMLRNLMHQVTSMQFSGKDDDPGLVQLCALRKLYDDKATELPLDFDTKTHAKWAEFVTGVDRKKAFRAFEAATMLSWRTSLRRGSAWVNHSGSFKNRETMLIPSDDWAANRDDYCALLGITCSAGEYVTRLKDQIAAGLAAVAQALDEGAVGIKNGKLELPQLEKLDIEQEAEALKELLFKRIGEVQLPDLLVQLDSVCGFSQTLLGRRARDERELTALYGAMLGLATGRTAKAIAKMLPGIEVAHVSSAMRAIEFPGRLRRANQAVLDFQWSLPITKCYGDGSTGSADMMSLAASQHLARSRTDPRMRTWAVGMYTHLLDNWGVAYDQHIVLMERQAAPAVHGLQMYNEEISGADRLRLEMLAVDTHGFTAVGMAVAKLLGFDLCPRLHSVAERKLYVFSSQDTPDTLHELVDPSVIEGHIDAGWDSLLRLCASIKTGRISALQALQRLGSAAHGDALHKAGDALGKILRTIYLCDFFSVTEFRREVLLLLNRGESSHALERELCSVPIRHDRGRRTDELSAISGSLALLTNIVIGWNLWKMHGCRQSLAKEKTVIEDEWMRRVSPAASGHINLNGRWSFSYDGFRESLIERHPAQRAKDSSRA